MKQVERYHEKGYYVLYSPHSKQYLESLGGNYLVLPKLTSNMFKAKQFGKIPTLEDIALTWKLLEGFEWREIHVNYIQTLVTET